MPPSWSWLSVNDRVSTLDLPLGVYEPLLPIYEVNTDLLTKYAFWPDQE